MRRCMLCLCMGLAVAIASVAANPARDAILAKLATQAKDENAAFAGFSAERGAV